MGGSPSLVIEGADGTLVLRRELHHSIEYAPLSGRPRPLSYVMPAELAQDAFNYCLHSALLRLDAPTDETMTIGDRIRSLQLAEAAYESARSGQAVRKIGRASCRERV